MAHENPQPRTVIFDFDGTLADTLGLVGRVYNEQAPKLGTKLFRIEQLPELRRMGYTKAMKYLGVRWSQLPKLVMVVSREMKQHMGEVQPYPGVVKVLKALQEQGIARGVLTSNNAELVAEFFAAHDFPPFDFVVSERTIFGKEKALKRIMRRQGLSREQVVYVGDEPRDVTASRKAGIRVIGVTWGLGGREGFETTPPDIQVDTAAALLKALKG